MANPTAVGSIPNQGTLLSVPATLDTSPYFSDVDAGNSLTYSASGFPGGTGLSINTNTGVISGTPTASDLAASYDVIVTATDEQDRTNTTTVSFVVSTAPSAAQNYYINGASGDDTAAGSEGAPWKTISRANTVAAHASGHVDIWVTPGNYRNQPIVPQNSGTDNSHRIRYRVNGSGVVNILGPSSGSILYGVDIQENYISILRESASNYFRVDGEIVFGTGAGEVEKNEAPEDVAKITRGMRVNGTGVVLDLNARRTAGWDGIEIGTACDLLELSINWEQHGTSHYPPGNVDFGDIYSVAQGLAVGS